MIHVSLICYLKHLQILHGHRGFQAHHVVEGMSNSTNKI